MWACAIEKQEKEVFFSFTLLLCMAYRGRVLLLDEYTTYGKAELNVAGFSEIARQLRL